jgi:hypothetical protein
MNHKFRPPPAASPGSIDTVLIFHLDGQIKKQLGSEQWEYFIITGVGTAVVAVYPQFQPY